jgi:hypothetical protein
MTINEYNLWLEGILLIPIKDNIEINKTKSFLSFSPEKFCNDKDIDEMQFIKKCNQDKKLVHNKILDSNNILKLELNKYKPDLTRNIYTTHIPILCICVNTFKSNGYSSKFKFYQTVIYTHSIIPNTNNYIIIDHRKRSIIITSKEFNLHFRNYRDYIIDNILN